jgi:hypothetical protein
MMCRYGIESQEYPQLHSVNQSVHAWHEVSHEGYLWRSTWFGVWRTRRYQRQAAAAHTTLARLIALRRQLDSVSTPTDLKQELQAQLGVLGRLLTKKLTSPRSSTYKRPGWT